MRSLGDSPAQEGKGISEGVGASLPGRDEAPAVASVSILKRYRARLCRMPRRAIFAHSQNQQQQITRQTTGRAPALHRCELRRGRARAAAAGDPQGSSAATCPPRAGRRGDSREVRRGGAFPPGHGPRDSRASRPRAAGGEGGGARPSGRLPRSGKALGDRGLRSGARRAGVGVSASRPLLGAAPGHWTWGLPATGRAPTPPFAAPRARTGAGNPGPRGSRGGRATGPLPPRRGGGRELVHAVARPTRPRPSARRPPARAPHPALAALVAARVGVGPVHGERRVAARHLGARAGNFPVSRGRRAASCRRCSDRPGSRGGTGAAGTDSRAAACAATAAAGWREAGRGRGRLRPAPSPRLPLRAPRGPPRRRVPRCSFSASLPRPNLMPPPPTPPSVLLQKISDIYTVR